MLTPLILLFYAHNFKKLFLNSIPSNDNDDRNENNAINHIDAKTIVCCSTQTNKWWCKLEDLTQFNNQIIVFQLKKFWCYCTDIDISISNTITDNRKLQGKILRFKTNTKQLQNQINDSKDKSWLSKADSVSF